MPAAVLNVDRLFADSDCFRHCIENRNCYVDRTQYIQYIVGRQRVAFLRPRRFGKSLWKSTLKEFFSGRLETFEGLAVYNEKISLYGHAKEFVWCPAAPEKHHFEACPMIDLNFSQLPTPRAADTR